MAPDGLVYVSSWVDETLERCFQVMETDDASLFDEWTRHWADLVAFEIIPVLTSAEAKSRVLGTAAGAEDRSAQPRP